MYTKKHGTRKGAMLFRVHVIQWAKLLLSLSI
jgi:hypothetical protein